MESSIQADAHQANGNGVQSHEPPPNVTVIEREKKDLLSDSTHLQQEQQRPRKLSFDDTDMELTKLKLVNGTVRKLPLSLMLAGFVACTAVSLLVPYLWSFVGSGSLSSALATIRQWRQFARDRVISTIEYDRWDTIFRSKMQEVHTLVQDPSLLLFAAMFAAVITWFTYYVVYLDSSIPGVNPPTPFSASKKRRFSDKERRFHLGYITAFLSGLTVFLIILFVD
ncbi:uncharacterized protein LOC129764501 [Toxorhynchites rutilus septentrionalis]|uniref:uncharacterized protein LOC129764501 n=1 Tax=Toxorhynchites rutilus septentrionalis TaxID=329112 RepID=UPI002478FB22|nr:uncharacterized protein LOC129764501 [Toxorhynchites rutilus septentrionalis]XP_055619601.1 uncharacterized protein LOC129764501 [Toxorhynchites rutilus septentrionalis]XP_055619602.1 uncharacterized protein LOC129764501 [Toxorhynchites rutilus septentrionalis]XP_055619603.1 uncharacterized protein LOC129764501 [Toxorhynchites rutilus septentrionalis]